MDGPQAQVQDTRGREGSSGRPIGAYADEGVLGMLLRFIAAYETTNTRWRQQLGLTANEHLVVSQLLADGPVTAAELTRRVGLTSGALTTLVDRLEKEGLIARVQDPRDRRRLLLYPSKKLLSASNRVVEPAAAALEGLAASFDHGDLDTFARLLEGATQALQETFSREDHRPDATAGR